MTPPRIQRGAEPLTLEEIDPVYGARPLRRFIQHEVETKISRALAGR